MKLNIKLWANRHVSSQDDLAVAAEDAGFNELWWPDHYDPSHRWRPIRGFGQPGFGLSTIETHFSPGCAQWIAHYRVS